MSLTKVNYIDNATIITAKNLNDIQDNIIQNAELIKKAAPRNLLDNSDFRNPINQREQTTYTVSGYTIDRWIANKAQPVIVNTDGITLDGTNDSIVLRQKLNTLKDGTYTVAIKVGDNIQVRQYTKEGTVYTRIYTSGDYLGGYVQLLSNSGVDEVQFRANSSNIITAEWIALYEGEYTAETLPEYQPKGYDAELAECQRYYIQFINNAFIGHGVVSNGTLVQGVLPGVRLRTTSYMPTVTGTLRAWNGRTLTNCGITSIIALAQQGNGMRINVQLDTVQDAGDIIYLNAINVVGISAEL